MELEIIVRWLHEARDVYNRTLSGGGTCLCPERIGRDLFYANRQKNYLGSWVRYFVDPRTSTWPLMDSPWPTLGICLFYAYFVKVLGPRLMLNRQPMNIRWLMVIYNFFMVIVSALIFSFLGVYGWFGRYNWYCQPVDYSNSKEAILMTHLAWWYYISKFVEFADTIFFVMRKKFSHISTLHVIHHGMMPMSVWWGVKFTPGGHSTFFAFINSLVHILMYFYYGLAAVGPHMYKYLWWKQYMTSFQMVQFIAIFVHSFQLLFRPDCEYPRGFMWWIGFHAVMFWFLFADFYKNAYLKSSTNWKSMASAKSTVQSIESKNNKINENGKFVVSVNGSISKNEENKFLNGYCYLIGLNDAENDVPEAERQYAEVDRQHQADLRQRIADRVPKNGATLIYRHKNGLQGNGQVEGPQTRSRIKKAV
ncbi:elongation of very long chain fatty acids protein-like [Tropilaelaps mercedesae]|uniref:Elongation of very long chain fatty acids protein n=1 Tax=Tropilaelaps mercedesae TaxID=418985 RepID=A0A1V9Y160_9ACAR|nr:elongation of very long chain fatty acids protein-like [Tropilaelaps mercedesae]